MLKDSGWRRIFTFDQLSSYLLPSDYVLFDLPHFYLLCQLIDLFVVFIESLAPVSLKSLHCNWPSYNETSVVVVHHPPFLLSDTFSCLSLSVGHPAFASNLAFSMW